MKLKPENVNQLVWNELSDTMYTLDIWHLTPTHKYTLIPAQQRLKTAGNEAPTQQHISYRKSSMCGASISCHVDISHLCP